MWIIIVFLVCFVIFFGMLIGISIYDEGIRKEKEQQEIKAQIMIIPCDMLYEHNLYKEFYLNEQKTIIKKNAMMYEILDEKTKICENNP